MRKAATEVGAQIFIGAQLLEAAPASWATATDKSWNTGVFAQSGNTPDFYIVHSYYTPFQTNSTAPEILNSASTVTSHMMEYVTAQMASAGVTPKPIALTEWNIFAEGSKQQVSYINGIHGALVLGELIKNKFGMASRWDLANGWGDGNDHGMFSQGDEPGGIPRWNPRPAFHYMYYFQRMFGDYLVSNSSTNPNVVAYTSLFGSGEAGVVVVNKGNSSQVVKLNLTNFGTGNRFYMYSLVGGTDNGNFSLRVFVNGAGPSLSAGGPPNVATIQALSAQVGDGITFTSPPFSVQYILVESGDNVVTHVNGEHDIHIYPNPSTGIIKIKLPEGEIKSIQLIDATGTVIISKLVEAQTEVELTEKLSPGLYLIRFKGATYTEIRKVIIQ
jgi:hypothetical protein